MRVIAAICLATLASGVTACSGSVGMSLPAIPALPSNAPEFPGSSTTVYARIARGANICWFGPRGALDRTYIWHARAEPEAKGGMAEILVHERFEQNQRGLKAFKITIGPKGEGAAVAVNNVKMTEAIAQRMTADAYRWARGGVGCTEEASDWSPQAPQEAAEPKKKVLVRKASTAKAGASEKSGTAGKPNAPVATGSGATPKTP